MKNNIIMPGAAREETARSSPKEPPVVHKDLSCCVDDVDAHCSNAKKQDANIVQEVPEEFSSDRTIQVTDPEGHHWFFHAHARRLT